MAQAENALLENDDDQIEGLDETQNDEQLTDDDQETDQDDDNQDDADTDGQDDDDDQEIVLEGDDGSHPQDEQRGIRKRINKLNAKVAVATEGEKQSAADLEAANERIRLLELAVESQNAPVDGPPDPNDFDDGVNDAGYIKANNDHITEEVSKRLQQTQQTTQVKTKADTQLHEKQIAHYKRADMLKLKDYDATEDAAIAILGQNVTNEIISKSDKSHELMYYFGKNESVAEEINELILSGDATKAVLRIGAIAAHLKTRPKSKRKPAPDPDGELSGGGPGGPRQDQGPKGAKFE